MVDSQPAAPADSEGVTIEEARALVSTEKNSAGSALWVGMPNHTMISLCLLLSDDAQGQIAED